MNLMQILPARYAKAITTYVGELVLYLDTYGATWHLVPAVIAIAVGLGVYGVPNAPAPAAGPPAPIPVYVSIPPNVATPQPPPVSEPKV